jgi:hypothetical protein
MMAGVRCYHLPYPIADVRLEIRRTAASRGLSDKLPKRKKRFEAISKALINKACSLRTNIFDSLTKFV